MIRKFLGDSDQATLPLQLLLIGLSANDNLMTGNEWDAVELTGIEVHSRAVGVLQHKLPLL